MSRPSTAEKKQKTASASSSAASGCRVLLLVGLPGSGKSTLARSLQPHWHWLDSDTAKLDDLLAAANKLLRHGQRVTLDRCDVTKDERLHILQQLNTAKVDCVWFDVDEATCLQRVLSRRGHATLSEAKMARKGEEYVKRMISGIAQRFQPPTVDEGYRAVHVVNSDESFMARFNALTADVPAGQRKTLLLDDGSTLQTEAVVPQPPPSPVESAAAATTRSTITKFPRTPHLFATGGSALSTDDLLLSPSQSQRFIGPKAAAVVVQEKVDGANIGFTLMADWSIAVQNRSHYVTAATHAQFSLLPQWIELHKAELNDLLAPPGRYTLFGEWCRARHSISYQALPDWLLAFDLYDTHTNRFWSFNRLQQRLADTTIALIPVLATRRYETVETLLEELKRPSRYTGDGRNGGALEGVVLRIESEDGQWLVERAKVVRPEFVQAITTHWSKQTMEKNRVVLYGSQEDEG